LSGRGADQGAAMHVYSACLFSPVYSALSCLQNGGHPLG
jgi:hypothetical protein